MQPHFAHIRLSDCHYSVENESREHLNLKAALFRWANQTTGVDVEVFLPDLQQVADVLVDERLALEVQCSSCLLYTSWYSNKHLARIQMIFLFYPVLKLSV